ncbi:MAG: DUF924 family protein [Pseudomonadota bacterium]
MSIVTPLDIWEYWIGPARDSAAAAAEQQKMWFGKSPVIDQDITNRFLPTLAALEAGLAWQWAMRGPRARLAAVIALDQFTRNIFRGRAQAFANDGLARLLTLEALSEGEHHGLMEAEQIFLYLPLEHSEDAQDQSDCVALFEGLAETARAEFVDLAESSLDYARRHQAVIDRFGRFPHRNALLGRPSTEAEIAYLSEPGASF